MKTQGYHREGLRYTQKETFDSQHVRGWRRGNSKPAHPGHTGGIHHLCSNHARTPTLPEDFKSTHVEQRPRHLCDALAPQSCTEQVQLPQVGQQGQGTAQRSSAAGAHPVAGQIEELQASGCWQGRGQGYHVFGVDARVLQTAGRPKPHVTAQPQVKTQKPAARVRK